MFFANNLHIFGHLPFQIMLFLNGDWSSIPVGPIYSLCSCLIAPAIAWIFSKLDILKMGYVTPCGSIHTNHFSTTTIVSVSEPRFPMGGGANPYKLHFNIKMSFAR